MKNIIKICLLFLMFIFWSCSDGTGPDKLKDPRKISWDTEILDGAIDKIWGSSSDNVYIGGYTGDVYRYNGKEWVSVVLAQEIHISAIFGFSEDNFWIGGQMQTTPVIVHWNGVTWENQNIEQADLGIIETIWGTDENNLWAGGNNSDNLWIGGNNSDTSSNRLYKYNQGTWELQPSTFLDKENVNRQFVQHIVGNDQGKLYLTIWTNRKEDPSFRSYIYQNINGQWILSDSLDNVIFGQWVSPSGVLYIGMDSGLYSKANNPWYRLVSDIVVFSMTGTDDNNIFFTGRDKETNQDFVAHYNGVDSYIFEETSMESISYSNIWSDGKEVFTTGVVYIAGQGSIAAHGK